MPLYYLCEQPDVATDREHGSGFVLPRQAAQRKASQGDARQDKPSRCVGQARRERCPLVLKNTVLWDKFEDVLENVNGQKFSCNDNESHCYRQELVKKISGSKQLYKNILTR